MKSNLVTFSLILSLNAFASDKPEKLKSKTIMKLICKEIVFAYGNESNDDDYYYDNTLASYGISIDKKTCAQMNKVITKKFTTKLGSKEYTTRLNLLVSNSDYKCSLKAIRNVSVTLDAQDKPVIKKSKWTVESVDRDESCFVKTSTEMLKLNFNTDKDKLTKLTVEEVSTLSLFSPDYLQLGEPDDGTVGTFETYYAYVKDGVTLGYINEYWYANSEGEWATVYILKYNAKGILLGNLISSYDADYCEYPGFEDPEKGCGK